MDALETLHNAIAGELTTRIEGGSADAATLGAAIRFLKDNGITAVAAPGSKLGDLLDKIGNPEAVSDEEYERIKKECAGEA